MSKVQEQGFRFVDLEVTGIIIHPVTLPKIYYYHGLRTCSRVPKLGSATRLRANLGAIYDLDI